MFLSAMVELAYDLYHCHFVVVELRADVVLKNIFDNVLFCELIITNRFSPFYIP